MLSTVGREIEGGRKRGKDGGREEGRRVR